MKVFQCTLRIFVETMFSVRLFNQGKYQQTFLNIIKSRRYLHFSTIIKQFYIQLFIWRKIIKQCWQSVKQKHNKRKLEKHFKSCHYDVSIKNKMKVPKRVYSSKIRHEVYATSAFWNHNKALCLYCFGSHCYFSSTRRGHWLPRHCIQIKKIIANKYSFINLYYF